MHLLEQLPSPSSTALRITATPSGRWRLLASPAPGGKATVSLLHIGGDGEYGGLVRTWELPRVDAALRFHHELRQLLADLPELVSVGVVLGRLPKRPGLHPDREARRSRFDRRGA